MRRCLLIVLAMVTGGCEDKADPEFGKCVAAEAKGDVLGAADACEAAVKTDPHSTSGKSAAQKLATLQPSIEKAKKDKADADAKTAAEAKAVADAKRAAQDAEDAKCKTWATICTLGRFPDGSERTTGLQRFKTKAECESTGVAAGVKCDPCRCRD